jgi:hypothetical protein
LSFAWVPQGEEEISYGMLRVWQHHPLHRRLPQEEEARLLQQDDYTKRNDYSKSDNKKKYRFRDKKKKKKFQKMMSRACAALSNLNFSSDDSSSSEEDERPKRKTGDFTSLCLMGKSSRHISNSDSDVMDGGLEDTWLMDSDCSRHMTRNKKWFSSLTPLSRKEYVTFGDDKKGKLLGTSVIKINDCFTLNDVALVDRLRYNLVFVSQLCDADLRVLFRKSDSHVLDSSGKRVCGISRIGNIFQDDFSSAQSSLRCLISQSSSELWKWHRRLGHLSFDLLCRLSGLGLLRGLHLLKFESDLVCAPCRHGKMIAASHSLVNTVMTKHPGQLLHMDTRSFSDSLHGRQVVRSCHH